MADPKLVSAKKAAGRNEMYRAGVPNTYMDRNLMATNPLKEQFEPTPAEPVRQHAKMAGAC
jgi:hypothetical protein